MMIYERRMNDSASIHFGNIKTSSGGDRHLLLFGSSFLGGLGLGSFLGCWLLCCRFLCLLGSFGLSCLFSLRLLCLFSLGLLCFWLLSRKLERTRSLFASNSSCNNLLSGNHLLKGKLDTNPSLSGVNLVIGNDVLEDGLTGGAFLVCQTLNGGCDHGSVRRVGRRFLSCSLLSLGSLSSLGCLMGLSGSSLCCGCFSVCHDEDGLVGR